MCNWVWEPQHRMKNMPLAFPFLKINFSLQKKKYINSGLDKTEVHVSYGYRLYRSRRVWQGLRLLLPHGAKQLFNVHIIILANRKEKGAKSDKGRQGWLPLPPHQRQPNTWPRPASRKVGKHSLYSRWLSPAKSGGFCFLRMKKRVVSAVAVWLYCIASLGLQPLHLSVSSRCTRGPSDALCSAGTHLTKIQEVARVFEITGLALTLKWPWICVLAPMSLCFFI